MHERISGLALDKRISGLALDKRISGLALGIFMPST